jgi:hypothetical protein
MNSKPESINIWNYKPWWCQPWSILLTGIAVISTSWFLLKTIWITVGISILILAWWNYFLILYPQMMQEYLNTTLTENENK